MSEFDLLQDENQWKLRLHAKLDNKMANKGISKDDREIMEGSKFSVSAFSAVRPRGTEMYIVERLTVLAPAANPVPIVNPAVQVPQTTAAFDAAESQSSADISPRRAAAARAAIIASARADEVLIACQYHEVVQLAGELHGALQVVLGTDVEDSPGVAKLARTVAVKSFKSSLQKTKYCHRMLHAHSQGNREQMSGMAISAGDRSEADHSCSMNKLERKKTQRNKSAQEKREVADRDAQTPHHGPETVTSSTTLIGDDHGMANESTTLLGDSHEVAETDGDLKVIDMFISESAPNCLPTDFNREIQSPINDSFDSQLQTLEPNISPSPHSPAKETDSTKEGAKEIPESDTNDELGNIITTLQAASRAPAILRARQKKGMGKGMGKYGARFLRSSVATIKSKAKSKAKSQERERVKTADGQKRKRI
ncbi:MAG: hypothetical protein Q9191_007207 [Dirinaria sp. TL-2023a]